MNFAIAANLSKISPYPSAFPTRPVSGPFSAGIADFLPLFIGKRTYNGLFRKPETALLEMSKMAGNWFCHCKFIALKQ